MEERIVRFLGLDFLAGKVGGGDIGAGVAVKADGLDVQESGLLAGADVVGGFPGHAEGLEHVEAVAVEILKARAVLKARSDPAGGGLGGNADAIVLADEEKGARGSTGRRSSLRY